MSNQPSEDDLHRWASDDFEYALQFRTPEEALACLKKLDRLDGHTFKILVGQLDGSIPPETYRNRFGLTGRKGKPPTTASEPSVRWVISRWFYSRLEQVNRKTAISETCKEWDIKKTTLEEILAEEKALHKPKGLESA